MWNKFKKLKMKCQCQPLFFPLHFVNVYNLYKRLALRTTKRIWLLPKKQRLHQWDNKQSVNDLKTVIFSFDSTSDNQELSTLQSGLKLRHLKRYSDSKRVVLHLLALSQKKNHLLYWSQSTSKRSKKQQKYKLHIWRIVTLQQEVSRFPDHRESIPTPFTASTHSYLPFVINAKTHLWDTALPMHKCFSLKFS